MPIVVNMLEETPAGAFVKILGQAEFTALVTRPDGSQDSLDRFYDDGTHGDQLAGDGDYTRLYPNTDQAGEYQIALMGWKGAIPVQAARWVEIMPFPEIRVVKPVPGAKIRSDVLEFVVHLVANPLDSPDQGDVVAHLTYPSGQEEEIVLKHGKDGYSGIYKPIEGGKIHVLIETRRTRYHGVDFQRALEYDFELELIHFVDVRVRRTQTLTGCLQMGREVEVSVTLSADGPEILHILASPGWEAFPSKIETNPGSQNVTVQLRSAEKDMGREDGRITLYVTGGDNVVIRTGEEIHVNVQNMGLLTRCQTPVRWGVGVFLALLTGAIGFHRFQARRQPGRISGTLRYGPRLDDNAHLVEVDLTALQKHSLFIGSSEACDVRIVTAGLDPEHARLVMEKQADSQVVLLEPLGQVQKGYTWKVTPFALHHAETFRMGTFEFQYLSDSGE